MIVGTAVNIWLFEELVSLRAVDLAGVIKSRNAVIHGLGGCPGTNHRTLVGCSTSGVVLAHAELQKPAAIGLRETPATRFGGDGI
jgi:hypothetical protein